jgi:deoxyribonuclease V
MNTILTEQEAINLQQELRAQVIQTDLLPADIQLIAGVDVEYDKRRPDVIICDGQGRAHPRRFGLACHMGVLLDIPTLGCGKTRLSGEYDEPGTERGSVSALLAEDDGEHIGNVLRTQAGINPVFVSSDIRFLWTLLPHLS